ncbi:hypothetical protein KY335_01560 [Candidatus Woesearchaeota archaeon]|nr:hypothetical protein [Candidatus Woesearchaeota archaeon]
MVEVLRRTRKGNLRLEINKKASLNLSINAIVVLILAITMLGLGLGFMKKTFGRATEQFGEVSKEVEKQLIDRLKESGDSVSLSQFNVEMEKSSRETVYLAIRNSLGCDDVQFSLDYPKKGDGRCDQVTFVGNCEKVGISTFTTVEVDNNEVKVLPMKIESESGVQPDTLRYPIRVTGQCPGGAGAISLDDTVELLVTII